MRVVAVLPFAADAIDPDANDLARWLQAATASELSAPGVIEARLVADAVEISAPALAEAAAQVGAEVALGARLRLDEGRVEISALLAGADGEVRGEWAESPSVGTAQQLPRMLARAALLALGEDASAPPLSVEPEAPGEAVLRLCRAARRIEESELDEGVADLLSLAEEQPGMDAPRRALLAAARAALGSDRMPAFFSALERLAETRPEDAEVLVALGEYRSAHLDEAGAREAFFAARDAADDPLLAARASAGLAALAEKAGHEDEAIQHLRAAVKMADDAGHYARLGELLLAKDPGEGVQMLARAAVLAPDDAALHLKLARAIREHGGDTARALAAAARAAELSAEGSEIAAEIRSEIELLLG